MVLKKYILNGRSYCGNPSEFDVSENDEEFNKNPKLFYGIFNFDNIGRSLFTNFALLSITGWSGVNDIVFLLLLF